jgi:hypothetical protein
MAAPTIPPIQLGLIGTGLAALRGLADRYVVTAFIDRAALLARDDVDAVPISVPIPHLYEVARDALTTGNDVLCEKPSGVDAEQAAAFLTDPVPGAGPVPLCGPVARPGCSTGCQDSASAVRRPSPHERPAARRSPRCPAGRNVAPSVRVRSIGRERSGHGRENGLVEAQVPRDERAGRARSRRVRGRRPRRAAGRRPGSPGAARPGDRAPRRVGGDALAEAVLGVRQQGAGQVAAGVRTGHRHHRPQRPGLRRRRRHGREDGRRGESGHQPRSGLRERPTVRRPAPQPRQPHRRHRRGRGDARALRGARNGGDKLLRVRRALVRDPLPLHRDGDVPAQGLVRGERSPDQAPLHVGGAARQRVGGLRPGEAALRLGSHGEPLRRRQRLHRERHQHLRRGDRGQHRHEGGVQLAGDRRCRHIHRRHLHEPEVRADAATRDRKLDRLEQQRELAGPDPGAHAQPVQRLRRLEDQEQSGLRQHAPVQRRNRTGDRPATRVRPVQLVRRVQRGEEPRPRQAGGEVHGRRERTARCREGSTVPGQPRVGQGVGLRPVLHQR